MRDNMFFNHLESNIMEILGFIIVVALVVYNIYFFYNVMFVLPIRGHLFMKLPFYHKVWEVRLVGFGQPTIDYAPIDFDDWEEVEDELNESDDDDEFELTGSLADDELDQIYKQAVPTFATEQHRAGYIEGYSDCYKKNQDALDFTLNKRIDEADYNIGYKDGYVEGTKDGHQEGYGEGFQKGCENSECGPLITELVHDLIDRKEYERANWLVTELDHMD
jgi:hypothetical protein